MLSSNLLHSVVTYATMFSPQEMCGLLFSKARMKLCTNRAEDPTRGFQIEPGDYYRACRSYEGEQPWAIVHSHPGESAKASVEDCRLLDAFALIQQPMEMVIVGLEPQEVRCYRKVGDVYTVQWRWTQERGWMVPGNVIGWKKALPVGPLEDRLIYGATSE